MEVHAHHSDKGSGKGFMHYLFDFLMLFLAVFCGFMAENFREHSVEHRRAKVYASNLYEELKKDTAAINKTIEGVEEMARKIDTFCLLSTEKKERNVSNGMLYYYASFTTKLSIYTFDNTTIEELKGSGNLRIMGNEVTQKINVYGKSLSILENEYALTKTEFGKIEELYFKIFDGYRAQAINDSKSLSRDSLFKLNIPLINDDPKLMKEFTGWQKFEVGIYHTHIQKYLPPVKKAATELLGFLKKRYHLD